MIGYVMQINPFYKGQDCVSRVTLSLFHKNTPINASSEKNLPHCK